jgi:glutathione S-transferase
MTTLYFHPLASYCWKVLIALYESDADFVPKNVDLADAQQRAELERLWPIGRFPVLRDGDRVIAESTTILEHLASAHSSARWLIPPAIANEVRALDRFFDLHVHEQMQKIVDDRLRPSDSKDPLGVSRARARLSIVYPMIEQRIGTWAAGDAFTMADCSAAPALYYAAKVQPLEQPKLEAYLQRLTERPSFARVLAEAAPYAHFFPE